ncbi:MAG: FprA family A-type flavoprotein [Thermoproteota archaeon]|nr:FprA family A-type flavoprotein [Candidatus Brockarchaeota archaeon]
MNWRNIVQISKDIYWVGAKDWNRRLFDALIPLPSGTTYNSYLILGKDKSALIDTVNPGFEKELEEKVNQVSNLENLDYIIMNHAEPDHAGAISYLMSKNNKVMLVCTNKGATMAKKFYNIPENRIKVVSNDYTINLGNKTLRFVEAPMLHWPETMFTYIEEDKILFPCDFFGAHVAYGIFDDEVENLIDYAQKYFGEIMMPFRVMAKKALEKIKSLEIRIIAPSHGPIYKNPERILKAYEKWVNGETRIKATILYLSMWGNTEKMVLPIIDILNSEGIETKVHNLTVTDIGEVAKDLVDSRAIVLGTPTFLSGAHPMAVYASHLVKALRPPTKFGIVLGSYGWSGGAVQQIKESLEALKIEVVGAFEVNGLPTEKDMDHIVELGKTLSKRIKESNAN